MKSKGLGDTVEKVIMFFSYRNCKKCKKRKELLNKMFPYGEHGSTETILSKDH